MIIVFGLTSLYLPEIQEAEPPPLEILAMVMEETIPELPPAETAPPVEIVPKPQMRKKKPVAVPVPKPIQPPQVVALAPPKKAEVVLPQKTIVLPENRAEQTDLPGPRTLSRQYRESKVVAGPVPEGKPLASFEQPQRQDKLITSSSRLNDRYAKAPAPSTTLQPTRKQIGLAVSSSTDVDLPEASGQQKNFKIARSTQSLRGSGNAKTFVPSKNGSEVAIRGTSGIGGDFSGSETAEVTSGSIPGSGKRSAVERVGMIGGKQGVEVPVLVGSGKASGSLRGTLPGESSPVGDGPVSGSVSFEGAEDGHYDPARMISLNQLNACIDPNAEWPLKTSLAAGLDTDGKCSIRSMIFFFKNTENGYTLQVDVFNPEQFVDRCEALRTAIQCINP